MPMLRWLDDDKARGNLTNVVMKILREDKALSYRGGTRFRAPADAGTDAQRRVPPCDNILVHGDNLEALKALLPFYAGKVKCIYIDPPYNTVGLDGFVCNDNFKDENYSAMRCKLSNSNSGTCGFSLRFRRGFSRSPFSIERE